MATVACVYCGTENQITHRLDEWITLRCSNCRRLTPTGREEVLRRAWEQCVPRKYPPVAAARSIALSNAIYKTAEEGVNTIGIAKTREALTERFGDEGFDGKGLVGGYLIKGRTHRGFTDSTAVAAVCIFDNGSANPRHSIYVVFRGSRGSIMAANDPTVNVDWRANFDNAMETTDYAGSTIRVHGGFRNSLSSYRDRVLRAMSAAWNAHPSSHVVVTGHSQGAGHAILFAHWLSYVQPEPRPFLIPFSPPRVGNFAFARDLTTRLGYRATVLPFDGRANHGSYLMVKGEDPVVFEMKHSFRGTTIQQTWAAADSDNILKQASYAQESEKHRYNPSDVYFHPNYLTQISSWTPKWGLLKGLDHKPDWFRDKILGNL